MKSLIERKGTRTIFVAILSIFMLVGGVLPFSIDKAYAADGKGTNPDSYGESSFFWIGDEVAYCFNHSANFPRSYPVITYDDGTVDASKFEEWAGLPATGPKDSGYTWTEDKYKQIQAILYYGYPNDNGGIAAVIKKKSTQGDPAYDGAYAAFDTAEKRETLFRWATQRAIWQVTDGIAPAGNSALGINDNAAVSDIVSMINSKGTTVSKSFKIYTTSQTTGAGQRYQALVSSGSPKPDTYDEDDQTPSQEVGSLKIQKTIAGEGASTDQIFRFKVTGLPEGTFSYTREGGASGGTIQNNGTVSLKGGQSVTITGIPVGTSYTVTEYNIPTYWSNTDKSGDTGTIAKDATSNAAFTNTYTAPSTDPEITNTTATANGKAATETAAATVEVGPYETVNVTLTDEVVFKNIDKEYKLVSKLYKQDETGPVQIKAQSIDAGSSSPITVSYDNLTTEGTYSIKTMLFAADATEPYTDTDAIFTHNKNLDQKIEMVTISKREASPSIGTLVSAGGQSATAASDTTEAKECMLTAVQADEVTTVTDTLSYKDLVPEKKYDVTAELYEVENGATVGDAIATVTVSGQGTSSTGTGTWTIDIPLSNAKLEPGKSYVVYEKATYAGSEPLAFDPANEVKHENPNDKAQTIVVGEHPQITNTTVTANGNVTATDDKAAEVNIEAGGEINVTLTDSVDFSGITGGYVLVSIVYKDGAPVETKETKIKSDTASPLEVTFDNLTATGEYNIGTKLYLASDTNRKNPVSTHNGMLDLNKERTVITRDNPTIKISKKVLGGDEVEGAEMTLTGPNDFSEKWTSNGQPKEFAAPEGDYVLKEVVAPAGLKKVTTEIKFSVADDGTVDLKTVNVDNGGKVSVESDENNHIVLEDAPSDVDLVKKVNGGNSKTLKSAKDTVEFSISATVPYGVTQFAITDAIPEPLLYVEDSLKATLGGKDLFNYDPANNKYGYATTDDRNVEVEVLSPVVDGTEGPSNIPPEEAWGKEVVVSFKCKLDPDADLSEFVDPVVNIAKVNVNGEVMSSFDGNNTASVLGIYELADDDENTEDTEKSKGAKTGDETPLGIAVIALLGAAISLGIIRRRRMN